MRVTSGTEFVEIRADSSSGWWGCDSLFHNVEPLRLVDGTRLSEKLDVLHKIQAPPSHVQKITEKEQCSLPRFLTTVANWLCVGLAS